MRIEHFIVVWVYFCVCCVIRLLLIKCHIFQEEIFSLKNLLPCHNYLLIYTLRGHCLTCIISYPPWFLLFSLEMECFRDLWKSFCFFFFDRFAIWLFYHCILQFSQVNIFDFSLGRGAVWSSAWNRVNNRFSVGCERKCQVVDVHARRQWVYSTGNSDALAQLFSVEVKTTCYSQCTLSH